MAENEKKKVMAEKDIVAGIKKKTKELNDLLVEAKKCPEVNVSIKIHGEQVKEVGVVNLVTIDLVKTVKL